MSDGLARPLSTGTAAFGNFTCPPGLVVVISYTDFVAARQVDSVNSDLWLYGVALSVLVTMMSALGGFLIKYAYNLARSEQFSEQIERPQ